MCPDDAPREDVLADETVAVRLTPASWALAAEALAHLAAAYRDADPALADWCWTVVEAVAAAVGRPPLALVRDRPPAVSF